MPRTAEMFDKPPRIKRMHVIDAGQIEGKNAARFYCERCETETGWYQCGITEAKRGLPCPECNAQRT